MSPRDTYWQETFQLFPFIVTVTVTVYETRASVRRRVQKEVKHKIFAVSRERAEEHVREHSPYADSVVATEAT